MTEIKINISSNFKLAAQSKSMIEDRLSKLYDHCNDIMSINIHCERHEHNQPHSIKCILELSGKTFTVSKRNKDMRKALDLVYKVLDRKLRRRSRLLKIKRHLNLFKIN